MKGNEPAVPVRDSYWQENNIKFTGYKDLTKREWFAGMAMQGLLSKYGIDGEMNCSEKIREWSYKISDAMLKESSNDRSKT